MVQTVAEVQLIAEARSLAELWTRVSTITHLMLFQRD